MAGFFFLHFQHSLALFLFCQLLFCPIHGLAKSLLFAEDTAAIRLAVHAPLPAEVDALLPAGAEVLVMKLHPLVVGRLAARHGIGVRLVPSPAGGVTSIITIAFIVGGAASYPHYLFLATVEVVCLLLIVWFAWQWRNLEA